MASGILPPATLEGSQGPRTLVGHRASSSLHAFPSSQVFAVSGLSAADPRKRNSRISEPWPSPCHQTQWWAGPRLPRVTGAACWPLAPSSLGFSGSAGNLLLSMELSC